MLRLIIGPARSGKTGTVMREIAGLDALERVFYLVPEQMTLAAQQALLDAVPGHGVMNTEVLSFNRFAHRIFEEVGLPARKVLDDVGKSLVLGADGRGTFVREGASGTVTVGGDLVLSNTVAAAPSSTLTFALDESGISPIR